MKPISQFLLIFIISAACGGVAYLMSESFYFLGGVFLAYFIVLTALVRPLFLAFAKKERKRHEGYRFVNSFIISYSSNHSLEKAYTAATEYSGPELQEVLKAIETKEVKERITYLQNYFESDLYGMFLSLYNLYEQQGGDLLSIAKGLLDEITRVEEAGDASSKESFRSLKDFAVLWVFSLAIFLFLRYGLTNFYGTLTSSITFLLTIGLYFGFLLFSLVVYAFRFSNGRLSLTKGKTTHEKAA